MLIYSTVQCDRRKLLWYSKLDKCIFIRLNFVLALIKWSEGWSNTVFRACIQRSRRCFRQLRAKARAHLPASSARLRSSSTSIGLSSAPQSASSASPFFLCAHELSDAQRSQIWFIDSGPGPLFHSHIQYSTPSVLFCTVPVALRVSRRRKLSERYSSTRIASPSLLELLQQIMSSSQSGVCFLLISSSFSTFSFALPFILLFFCGLCGQWYWTHWRCAVPGALYTTVQHCTVHEYSITIHCRNWWCSGAKRAKRALEFSHLLVCTGFWGASSNCLKALRPFRISIRSMLIDIHQYSTLLYV